VDANGNFWCQKSGNVDAVDVEDHYPIGNCSGGSN
jgi:hypothetical protein